MLEFEMETIIFVLILGMFFSGVVYIFWFILNGQTNKKMI